MKPPLSIYFTQPAPKLLSHALHCWSRVLWGWVHLSEKNPQPQQATQHKTTWFAVPPLMRWKQLPPNPNYSPAFPQFAAEHVGHPSPSAPQRPAPEFGPFFFMLSKIRWFCTLTWKRKFIPTHPASMAAGIYLK